MEVEMKPQGHLFSILIAILPALAALLGGAA
jgi:hypothetical protein